MDDQGPDRVRARTPAEVNARIDHSAAERIEDMATSSSAQLQEELARLDRQWSLERVVALVLGTLTLGASLLGARRRSWLMVAGLAGASAVRFAISGGGPGLVALRRAGLRTRHEIEAERCALKALRGDFEVVRSARSPVAQAGTALQAALR